MRHIRPAVAPHESSVLVGYFPVDVALEFPELEFPVAVAFGEVQESVVVMPDSGMVSEEP